MVKFNLIKKNSVGILGVMKRLLLGLILLCITISVNGQTRTDTKYYGNGDKQIVIHYQGSGDNEYVIKKNHYYTQNQGGGLSKVETYRSGKLHGTIKEYNVDGTLKSELTCENGKKIKLVEKNYYGNLIISEVNYKYLEWNPHQKTKDGLTKNWDANGNIVSEENYNEGRKINLKEYYSNGKIKEESNYVGDKLNGVHKTWYENGNIKSENNYKEGQLNGLSKEWFKDGQLKQENNYKNGSKYYGRDFKDLTDFVQHLYDTEEWGTDCEGFGDITLNEKEMRSMFYLHFAFTQKGSQYRTGSIHIPYYDQCIAAFDWWYPRYKELCGFE